MWPWRHREQLGIAFLAATAIAFLAAALWLVLLDRAVSAATAGVLGLLLLAFVRLSRFKKFRGLGFEAELWEDKQLEAERLISQTKGMLTLFGTTLLTAVPRMNRMMQAFSVPDQLALAAEVERMLREYGVSKEDLAGLYAEIEKWHAWDIAAPICRQIRLALDARSRAMHCEVAERFGSPVTDIEGFNRESAAANEPLKHIFSSNDLVTLPTKQWPNEIERRLAELPLNEAEARQLRQAIGTDLQRLRHWLSERRFQDAPN